MADDPLTLTSNPNAFTLTETLTLTLTLILTLRNVDTNGRRSPEPSFSSASVITLNA